MDENLDLTKNTELKEALQEFEAKTIQPQKQEDISALSSIDTVSHAPSISTSSDAPKMVQMIMKLSGGTINEKNAEYILLGLVIAMMSLSAYLVFGNKPNNIIPPDTRIMPGEFMQ